MDALLFCETCGENRVHKKDGQDQLVCTKCGAKRGAAEPEPALATEARA